MKHEIKISKIATIIIFIALVRTISEPFRLQYYSTMSLGFEQIEPFLIGGLITSIGLLIMTILSYYGRHKLIILFAAIIIIAMLMVKYIYL